MPFVHPPWHPPQQSSYSPATFNEDVDSFQQAPLSQGYRCSLWNPIHHEGEQISGKSGRFFSGLHVGMANIDKLKTTSCMTEPILSFQHLKLDYFFQRVENLYFCHELIFTKDYITSITSKNSISITCTPITCTPMLPIPPRHGITTPGKIGVTGHKQM